MPPLTTKAQRAIQKSLVRYRYQETSSGKRPETVKTATPSKKAKKVMKRHGVGKDEKHHKLRELNMHTDDEYDLEHSQYRIEAPPIMKPSPEKLLKLIKRTATAIRAVGGPQDVHDLIAEKHCDDLDTMKSFQQDCATLSNILQSITVKSELPSTSKEYEKAFVFWTSKHIYALQPADVFHISKSVDTKVFGFVRQFKGPPLMCALPGWTEAAHSHPRFLVSNDWGRRVLAFAESRGFEFPPYMYEKHHGVSPGTYFASHVEPMLMLWFCCDLLKKYFNPEKPIEDQWRRLDLLRGLKNIEAEIVITEGACDPCKDFKGLIKHITGFKFSFQTCPTLELKRMILKEEPSKSSIDIPRQRKSSLQVLVDGQNAKKMAKAISNRQESRERSKTPNMMTKVSRTTTSKEVTSVSTFLDAPPNWGEGRNELVHRQMVKCDKKSSYKKPTAVSVPPSEAEWSESEISSLREQEEMSLSKIFKKSNMKRTYDDDFIPPRQPAKKQKKARRSYTINID